MSTSTNSINRSDRRAAVRALAAASLAALDGIEKAKLADIADLRAKMQDALRWGDGSRLPQSAKVYRKTQQPDGQDTWWYRLDGDNEEMGCVLHTVFDWITGANDRSVDLDDGMATLRAAVEYHVRNNKLVLNAACAAAGYDESRLSVSNEGGCSSELHVDTDVANPEDARLSKDIAELRADIAEVTEKAQAQKVLLDEITRLAERRFPARARHLTLVVSNGVRRSNDAE